MSDLHRAVEDEIEAFRPDQTPPFAALVDRHRARTRRRHATGAAALSAVAVAGIVFMPSALFGGEDRLPSLANPEPTQAGDPELAARLCAGAATEYSGEVAAAYGTTVQAVRDHMADPHGTGGDSSVGPIPGPYTYPAGWAEKAADDPAAACYIDADFPTPRPPGAPAADRALIMAAEGAAAFMATAGPKESLPLAPLPESSTSESEIDAGPTRYTLLYDDEAAYDEHAQAVQACLDLAGVAYVNSEETLPPIVRFTVTGAAESMALRDCMSSLGGVTLTVSETPPAEGPDFSVEPVQQGFRNLHTGYKEQAGDGPVRIVDRYRNEGAVTRSATFVLTLREEDGSTVWVGRATVTDLAPGQEFQVTYEGTEPVPDGDQYQQWHVEDVIRENIR